LLSTTLNISTMWSLFYLIPMFYFIFVITVTLYLVFNLKNLLSYYKHSSFMLFVYNSGLDLLLLLITVPTILLFLNYAWVGPSLVSWFGHLAFSSMQHKIIYFISIYFILLLLVYSSVFYYNSQEVYDYTVILFSFYIWLILLFFSTNLFTLIFLIELLSSLILLLITTSTFSSTYFYNNLNLSSHSYFNSTTPFSFLQSILFFFWVSLIGSLNLFFFLILFYLKFFSFDWFFIETVFLFFITTGTYFDTVSLVLVWYSLIFCIFLKCGLPPFFFWKPSFFKGLSLHFLFFYTTFFYFFFFIFLIYFFSSLMSDIFCFCLSVNLFLIILSFLLLITLICESFYIKAFIAISSIINSLFVLMALTGGSSIDINFIL